MLHPSATPWTGDSPGGIIYLAVGVLGFVVPGLFGLIPHGYTVFDNLLHLALGIVSIALGFFAGAGTARS